MARGEKGAPARLPHTEGQPSRKGQPSRIPEPKLRIVGEEEPTVEAPLGEQSREQESKLKLPHDPTVQAALRDKLSKYDQRKRTAPDGSLQYIDAMYKAFVLQQLLTTGEINPAELRAIAVPERTLGKVDHGEVFENAIAAIRLHIDRFTAKSAEARSEGLEANDTSAQVALAAVANLLDRISEEAGDQARIQTRLDNVTFNYLEGGDMSATEYAENAFNRMVLTGDAQLVAGTLDKHIKQFEAKLASNPTELTQDDLARGIVAEVRRIVLEDPMTRVHYFRAIEDPTDRLNQMKVYFGIRPRDAVTAERVNLAIDKNLYERYGEALVASGIEQSSQEWQERMESYDDQLAVLEDLILEAQRLTDGTAVELEETDNYGEPGLETQGPDYADDWLETETTEVTDAAQVQERISELRDQVALEQHEAEQAEGGLWAKVSSLMKRAMEAMRTRKTLSAAEQQLEKAESLTLKNDVVGAIRIVSEVEADLSAAPLRIDIQDDWLTDEDRLGEFSEKFFSESQQTIHERERVREATIDAAELENLRGEALTEIEHALDTVEKEIAAGTPQTPEDILIWNAPAEERRRVAQLMRRRELLQSAMLNHPDAERENSRLRELSGLFVEGVGPSRQELRQSYLEKNLSLGELGLERVRLLRELGLAHEFREHKPLEPETLNRAVDKLRQDFDTALQESPANIAPEVQRQELADYENKILRLVNSLVVVDEITGEKQLATNRKRAADARARREDRQRKLRSAGRSPFSVKF